MRSLVVIYTLLITLNSFAFSLGKKCEQEYAVVPEGAQLYTSASKCADIRMEKSISETSSKVEIISSKVCNNGTWHSGNSEFVFVRDVESKEIKVIRFKDLIK